MKNPQKKIEQLRSQGYKVFVSHRRPVNSVVLGMRTREELKRLRREFGVQGDELDFLPTGGRTEVRIEEEGGRHGVCAMAHCCDFDNFNRHRGLQIALGRAVKLLETSPFATGGAVEIHNHGVLAGEEGF